MTCGRCGVGLIQCFAACCVGVCLFRGVMLHRRGDGKAAGVVPIAKSSVDVSVYMLGMLLRLVSRPCVSTHARSASTCSCVTTMHRCSPHATALPCARVHDHSTAASYHTTACCAGAVRGAPGVGRARHVGPHPAPDWHVLFHWPHQAPSGEPDQEVAHLPDKRWPHFDGRPERAEVQVLG